VKRRLVVESVALPAGVEEESSHSPEEDSMSRTPGSVLAELRQLTAEFAQGCQASQRDWHGLRTLGWKVCDRSQELHLLLSNVRRRAQMPCNDAARCLQGFVDHADHVLAQWGGNDEDKEDLKLYRNNVAKRIRLLKELGERKADLDKDLGYLAADQEMCSLA
jgi:hypothetical protein